MNTNPALQAMHRQPFCFTLLSPYSRHQVHTRGVRKIKVIIALASIFLAGLLPSAHAQTRATLQACVERASTDSALYPQRLDRVTTITGVSCRENAGRIIYTYDNKIDIHRSQLSPDAMSNRKASISTMLCTNPKLTALLNLVDMEYVYYDADDVHIGSIVNRIEDCERVSSTKIASPSSQDLGNWVAVNLRNDGKAVLEIDSASIVRKGNKVRVWTRAVYESAFSIDGSGTYTRKVLALNEIHCVDRTERVRRIVFLGEDDQPILGADKGPFETADIVPGSPKENVLRFVCSSTRKKS